MEDKISYWDGHSALPEEHKSLLEAAFIESMIKNPEKEIFVKFMEEDEQRSNEQNSTFWKVLGIVKRLGTITKINYKGKTVPKSEEEILTECMENLHPQLDKMVLGYRYVKDGKICKTTKKSIALTGTDIEAVRNSTTRIGKKRFSELIKYVLDYCELNMANMNNSDHKEFCKLREQLVQNGIDRLREKENKKNKKKA